MINRILSNSLLVVASLLLTASAMEIGDEVLYHVQTGRWIWRDGPAPLPPRVIQALPESDNHLQLHPYYGFMAKPGLRLKDLTKYQDILQQFGQRFADEVWPNLSVNNAGFWSVHDYPFAYDSTRDFVIGVFGGSVAEQFSLTMDHTLAGALKDDPRIAGKHLVLLDFGNGGAKQPQQLEALAYFLTLGQKFDLVLNLDGFNELFGAWLNLHETHTRIEMPLGRFLRGIQTLALSTELLAEGQETKAALAGSEAWRSHVHFAIERRIADLVVNLRRRHLSDLERRVTTLNRESTQTWPLPLPASDPDVNYEQTVAEQWLSASIAMHNLAAGFGIPYLHVLQPNQYFRHEEFDATDRDRFLNVKDPPLGDIVPRVYNEYLARTDALRSHGVAFLDATGVFMGKAAFYNDDCCHFNPAGNQVLARLIASRIATLLAASQPH